MPFYVPSIIPACADWPIPQLQKLRHDNADVWVCVPDSFADYMLEVVPPVYVPGGFLVGEPDSHDAQGYPVRLGFAHVNGQYFARYATKHDWPGLRISLLIALSTPDEA